MTLRVKRKNTYTHVVNPFLAPSESDNYNMQQVTFKAMENAWKNRGNLSVDLLTAQFKEDHVIIPSFFQSTPDLIRSIADFNSDVYKKKLPFIEDILKSGFLNSKSEYIIFTNIDIIPSLDFYTTVDEFVKRGIQAFTINRRTISKFPNSPDKISEIMVQKGKPHPGHDCFIFPRNWIEQFDVGKIVVGVPWVGFIILINIACIAKGVPVLKDLYITRHLGDDTQWLNEEHEIYRYHNAREALSILNRLQQRYGNFNDESYIGQHIRLAQKQISEFERNDKHNLLFKSS